jgi:hypothetical protein
MGFLRRVFGGDSRGSHAEPQPTAQVAPKEESVRTATSAACPHCGVIVDPIPPRRRLCPECRQPIIPRTRADGARLLLREADLPAIAEWDRAWRAQRQAGIDYEAWITKTAELVGRTETAAIDTELRAKSEGYSGRDVYWMAANRAVLRALKANDWGTLSRLYFDMALTDYRESDEDKESERALRLKRESNLAQLRYLGTEGLGRVDVLACECSVCSRGPKRRLAIRDQLALPTIPHADCREGWCTCEYVASFG